MRGGVHAGAIHDVSAIAAPACTPSSLGGATKRSRRADAESAGGASFADKHGGATAQATIAAAPAKLVVAKERLRTQAMDCTRPLR